ARRSPRVVALVVRARGRRRRRGLLRVRRLDVRPADAGDGRAAGRRQPRRLAGPDRARSRMADRGMGSGRGDAADAPARGGAVSTLALELQRSVPRSLAPRTIGRRLPGPLAGPDPSLRLVQRESPVAPAARWAPG